MKTAAKTATTLVHQGAMQIALHAVRSFARYHAETYRLDIHTDGSVDKAGQDQLLAAAEGMEARIVTSADRRPALDAALADYPLTRELIGRGGYFAKMELPMVVPRPYFYFDSDIVWLAPAMNLEPVRARNAFSTESWSWYYGVARDSAWIRDKVPRRVNSGFYHLKEEFPFERMEKMMEKGHFDPTIPYNTDQEIMAYLFRDMELYHPDDLKRSRVGTIYDLSAETCAALHFPGRMWKQHIDQIQALYDQPARNVSSIRHQDPVALSHFELFRMRLYMKLANSRSARAPINLLRKTRNALSR